MSVDVVLPLIAGALITGLTVAGITAGRRAKEAGVVEAGAQPFWHRLFHGRRCSAVKEPNPSGLWGRCERPRGHDGDHALERGMDVPRWSTGWTQGGVR